MSSDRRGAITERLSRHGQEHVLRFADELDGPALDAFLDQLDGLELDRLQRFIAAVLDTGHGDGNHTLEPPELIACDDGEAGRERDARARQAGEALLAEGKVAAFLVAGGQGTRLGYDGPKGRFPVGPLTDRSLFAYHAQRVLAAGRRYGRPAPYYVMTSAANHDSSVAAFEEAGWFGLDPDDVMLFQQGMLPAVDRSGKLLLSARDSLALSPDGHGGCFHALQRSGALEDMRRRGVEQVFYFQVDNPLAQVLDPVFIGHHVLADAQMSTKVVSKTDAAEKVGVLGKVDGRTAVIEYSDLSEEQARATDPDGKLTFRAGNIAIHMLSLDFVAEHASGGLELPIHRADKKVPFLDEAGERVEPAEPNAIKMEMFVFDALPLAERTTTQEVRREDEFAPVKNAEGNDSPATARAALSGQARRWIAGAGLQQPETAEVGPLFALDEAEFLRNLTRSDFGPVFDRA